MPVGSHAPWMTGSRRPAIRTPVSELDKTSVISIFPKHIIERKCTLQPGIFELQKGTFAEPSILVVGPSSWWKDVNDEEPLLEIPTSSIVVAESIVKDYCNGYFACNMGDRMPGLFFLPGVWTVEKLKKEAVAQLNDAKKKQDNWYKELVKQADVLWARSNGNPLAISDDMRLAAKELNLASGKDWMKDMQTLELVRCVACGSMRNPLFPMCSNCKTVIDSDKYKKLGLSQAQ